MNQSTILPPVPIYDYRLVEDVKSRMAPLRSIHIRRREDDLIESHVHELLGNRARNLIDPECEEHMGLMILGDSGSGKSRVVRKRIASNPGLHPPIADGLMPYASVKLRAPVKLQTAGFQTVQALGYPALSFKEKANYWNDVTLRIQKLGTRLLHFDEVQDIFTRTRAVDAEVTVAMFKSLMTFEAHPLVLVLTGMPTIEPHMMGNDPQAPRRFQTVVLPPVSFPADVGGVKTHVDSYCAKVGIENNLEGSDYHRLMHSAEYQFGRTFARALDGITEALYANSPKFERMHLAHAFERHRHGVAATNPFVVEDFTRLKPGRHKDAPETSPKKRKGRPRQETKY